jgi:hypothetical protein
MSRYLVLEVISGSGVMMKLSFTFNTDFSYVGILLLLFLLEVTLGTFSHGIDVIGFKIQDHDHLSCLL